MTRKYPFYFRATIILFGLILFSVVLFYLRAVLVPLGFALLLAILLNPIVLRFEKWGLPGALAISASILLALIVLAGVTYLLYTQLANFSDQLPLFKQKFAALFTQLQTKASRDYGVSLARQNQYIAQAQKGIQPVLAAAMGTVLGTLSTIVLLPVYTFLFLYYKNLILNFLYEIFAEENAREVAVVLGQTKGAVQSYMIGLLLEALIIATLNTTALLILGVDYAILLAVIGALLNILPFIGGIIAVLPPILIATVTKDGIHTQVGIILAYMVIQFIDNHFISPYIVSSKVKINALISIVAVLLGGALWGISGMFLSIPFIGVLKIIFDRIPELQPWGRLLGMEVSTKKQKITLIRIKRKSAARRHKKGNILS